MNNNNEYIFEQFSTLPLVSSINKIVKEIKEPMEGNCLYQHHSNFKFHRDNKEALRQNIYTLCKQSKSILEIGFNAGHSAALYTYANPEIIIRSFDLCSHKYSKPCGELLARTLSDFKLIPGDSRETLRDYNEAPAFDLIHIDGGHGYSAAKSDLYECKKFSTKETILIFDDAYHTFVEKLLTEETSSSNHTGMIREVNYTDYNLIPTKWHRVFKYE